VLLGVSGYGWKAMNNKERKTLGVEESGWRGVVDDVLPGVWNGVRQEYRMIEAGSDEQTRVRLMEVMGKLAAVDWLVWRDRGDCQSEFGEMAAGLIDELKYAVWLPEQEDGDGYRWEDEGVEVGGGECDEYRELLKRAYRAYVDWLIDTAREDEVRVVVAEAGVVLGDASELKDKVAAKLVRRGLDEMAWKLVANSDGLPVEFMRSAAGCYGDMKCRSGLEWLTELGGNKQLVGEAEVGAVIQVEDGLVAMDLAGGDEAHWWAARDRVSAWTSVVRRGRVVIRSIEMVQEQIGGERMERLWGLLEEIVRGSEEEYDVASPEWSVMMIMLDTVEMLWKYPKLDVGWRRQVLGWGSGVNEGSILEVLMDEVVKAGGWVGNGLTAKVLELAAAGGQEDLLECYYVLVDRGLVENSEGERINLLMLELLYKLGWRWRLGVEKTAGLFEDEDMKGEARRLVLEHDWWLIDLEVEEDVESWRMEYGQLNREQQQELWQRLGLEAVERGAVETVRGILARREVDLEVVVEILEAVGEKLVEEG